MVKPIGASYYLDLQTVTDEDVEQFQAQSAELWLRYRVDQRRMLIGFFRTVMEVAGDRRHGRITAAVVKLEADPTDTLDALEQDLGTAMARILALVNDPQTLHRVSELWSGLLAEVQKLRVQVREQLAGGQHTDWLRSARLARSSSPPARRRNRAAGSREDGTALWAI